MDNQDNKHDDIDKQIITFIQYDIPLEPRPYKHLADNLGISEYDIVVRIRKLISNSILRRFGAVLRHQKAGYDSNAMVAWQAEKEEADTAGELMAGFSEVSHCYLRETSPEFGYNLFTMIHARNEEDLQEIVTRLSNASGLKEYTMIKSLHEFKKISMTYY